MALLGELTRDVMADSALLTMGAARASAPVPTPKVF